MVLVGTLLPAVVAPGTLVTAGSRVGGDTGDTSDGSGCDVLVVTGTACGGDSGRGGGQGGDRDIVW